MLNINSRYNKKIITALIAGTLLSILLSLFLLQLFAGILSVLYLSEKWTDKKRAFDTIGLAILIFGVARIISMMLSVYPSSSIPILYKELLFYLSFFSLSFYFKFLDANKFKMVIYAFIIGGAISALVGIIKFDLNLVYRAESFSSGCAAFSSYLLVVVVFLASLYDREETTIKKYVWLGILTLISSGIILSLVRTNIVIALILVAGIMIYRRVNIKYILIFGISVSVICAASFKLNIGAFNWGMTRLTYLSNRDIIIKGFIELADEHPVFGYGPRTFHDIFPFKKEFRDKGIGSWHNDFIQVYIESGAIGLITFLFLIILLFYEGLGTIRKNQLPDQEKKTLLGLLLAVTAIIGSGLTAGYIFSPTLSILFAYLSAGIGRLTEF